MFFDIDCITATSFQMPLLGEGLRNSTHTECFTFGHLDLGSQQLPAEYFGTTQTDISREVNRIAILSEGKW
ncbi:hypothetical protein D3C86_1835300 [compost metagenome]